MAEAKAAQNEQVGEDEKLPEAVGMELRRLSHDLSNALEIVVQTSYLLSTVELKAPATEWLSMLEDGVGKALTLNNTLRSYVRDRSR